MDDTDLAILREMMRGRVFFWATLDPRVSAESIARRLKLSPTTVRARLRAWRASGFLATTHVVPHPALLGLRLGAGNVRIDDVRAKPAAVESLALIPGVFTVLDHVGPWLALNVLAESDAAMERLRKLAARLPGIDEVSPCHALAPPPPRRDAMTPLEWRMVRALRDAPDAPLARVAASVGTSTKTFARKYGALLADNMLLYVPEMDFARVGGGTVVRFIVALRPGEERARGLAALRRLPRLMEAYDASIISPGPDAPVSLWMHLPSVSAIEETTREILAIPGVVESEHVVPVRGVFARAWIDEMVDARLAAAEQASAARPRR